MSGKYRTYPEYKDSEVEWLGAIPSHWARLPLKYMTGNKVKDGPHETPKFIDDGVPFLSVDGIQNNELVFDGCRYVSEEDHQRFSLKCCPTEGDVLLGKAASVGKVAYVNTSCVFNVWSPLAVITPKVKASGRFIFYSIQSAALQAQCDLRSNSNTQKNLGMGDIDNLFFAAPNSAEQAIIVDFLDHETAKIDTLIDKQQQLIKLLKEKRQAVISHAVTKGLNPDLPMKDSGVEWLGEVPEHWSIVRIKQIASFITSGPRGWSDLISDEGEDIFLQSGDLNNELEILPHKAKKVIAPKGAEGVRTKLIEGDVVVCITGANTGRVAVVQNLTATTYINQHLCLIRPIEDKVDATFIGYALSSQGGRAYFDVTQYGLKEGLSLSNVAEAPLPLPPLNEQKNIVQELHARLSVFSRINEVAENQVEILKERRTALISAAVTGKIDVRNWQPAGGELQRLITPPVLPLS